MNNDPVLSIVVPVYNSEKYLRRCLDSILAQTFTDFEVILIDDCSPDNSVSICREYAEKDARVKMISHEVNRGVSAARNTGLKNVTGQFVGFVDGDDYISPKMYETLFDLQRQYDADISICGIKEFKDDSEIDENTSPSEVKVFTQEEYAKIFFKIVGNRTVCYPPNKLLKREVAERICYPVGLTSEDVLGFCQELCGAAVIVESDEPLYWYFFNTEGITHSGFSERDFHLTEIWDKVVEYTRENAPQYTEYAVLNRKRIAMTILYRMHSQKVKGYEDRERALRNELKGSYKTLMNSNMPSSRKMVLRGYRYCYSLTKTLLGLRH